MNKPNMRFTCPQSSVSHRTYPDLFLFSGGTVLSAERFFVRKSGGLRVVIDKSLPLSFKVVNAFVEAFTTAVRKCGLSYLAAPTLTRYLGTLRKRFFRC